ncbi:hypothetical protein EJ02DRAFT_259923 [Clathrospora elynae]|uniref:CENP-V/GFA domain-containing protein n=1 Tax=Clathrospora elynae TaxID=706981 RepID=A0A6A5SF60_9PLEO|nr:hypothetical protein EJ02DRAFT_259923 [Clathrospora elynae]
MSQPKSKPFPAITGSCVCNTIRYRLLTSPLYCYACHCTDCQKSTGSAFSLALDIERHNIKIISPASPVFATREQKPGAFYNHVQCPKCKGELWNNHTPVEAVCTLKVGTLDFPSLMEPDLHIFVDSKLDWVTLPLGAKTTPSGYDVESFWPKSSLKRLEVCVQRAEEVKKNRITAMKEQKDELPGHGQEEMEEEFSGEGEKTPTAVEFWGDDEGFEKRFKETERALQERLEKLSLKLKEEEAKKNMGQTAI